MSDEFLSGPDGARQVMVNLLRLCKKYDVELLFEAPGIRNDKDMEIVESLLGERDSGVPQPPTEEKTSSSKPGTDANTTFKSGLDTDAENPFNLEQGTTGKTNRGKVPKEIPAKRPKLQDTTAAQKAKSPITGDALLQTPAIVLFGSHDVRWHDNNAVHMAAKHSSVLPVFLWDRSVTQWGVRGAQQVVLKSAVRNLELSLDKDFQLPLICRNVDDPVEALLALVKETNAGAVYWNREFTPESRALDKQREAVLHDLGVQSVPCVSSLLYDVEKLELSKGFHGGHWGTLMPFLNGCRKQFGPPPRPIPTEDTVGRLIGTKPPPSLPAGIPVAELELATMTPNTKWDEPILQRFRMSFEVARQRLDRFFRYLSAIGVSTDRDSLAIRDLLAFGG